jgi:hypothetical protein
MESGIKGVVRVFTSKELPFTPGGVYEEAVSSIVSFAISD